MSSFVRGAIVRWGAGLLAACAVGGAAAQGYPNRPVHLVVPYTAGGVADILARAVAAGLTQAWGQPVVVENKAGASMIIGSEYVAKAAPDGYTLLLANDPALSSNQYLFSKLSYDPVRDFTPIINMVSGSTVLVAGPALKGATFADFIAQAKAHPGEVTYGSFGIGSSTHLDTEELAIKAGVKLNHIPYKGIADVMPAVMSGQIVVALAAVSPVLELIRSGKLKALAYAGSKRSAVMPDVPTYQELGIPFETSAWFGLAAPAGTPQAIVNKIAADTHRIITQPEFDKRYVTGVGFELADMGPQAFVEFLKKDREVWALRARIAGVKLD